MTDDHLRFSRAAARDVTPLQSNWRFLLAEAGDNGGELEAVDGFREMHLIAFRKGANAIFGPRVGCEG